MLAEAESDRLIGQVVGGAYELVGRIGEGGMGAVYEAHHLRLQKRVAVKVMSRAMARHPDALARFHREARIASRLGHPNLVNVIDFGTSNEGEPYLVMEHLEGEDLERRLRRAGSVPLANAVKIARQVASALAVVHAKGIVHRDLKPANIFLVQVPGEPDLVKVLDFGVSKIKAAGTKLTDAMTVLGTPEYMSPEQASGSGEDIDHRADQWALACIVWEMLAGRTPFTADHADAIFYQLAHVAPPPIAKFTPGLPPAVEPVLLRALAKNAADRYPSVKEFARALATAALGNLIDFTPAPLSPTQIAHLRPTLAASIDAESDASDNRGSAGRRGHRARSAVVGLAVMVAVTATGLLFADARGGASNLKPAHPASVTNLSIARFKVVEQPSSPLPSKPDTMRPGASVAPAERTPTPSGSVSPEKSSSLARPSASRAQRSASRAGKRERHEVLRPDGRRPIFEEL